MAEVGVKRLGAGDGEEDGAERIEADHSVVGNESEAVGRIERPQHAGIACDPKHTGNRNRHEPDRRDRPEQGRDLRRTPRLEGKEHDQDHHGDRHHVSVQCRSGDVHALDRGKNRQRRRNDGVAVEQRGADDAEQRDEAGGPARAAKRARGERHEGKRTALAVVVRAQQDHDVLQGDDDEQRPQNQRQHPEHRGAGKLAGFGRGSGDDRFAERVERARADVAVDDADAADGEPQQPGAGASLRAGLRRRIGRRRSTHGVRHGTRNRMSPAPAAASRGDAGPRLYTLRARKS